MQSKISTIMQKIAAPFVVGFLMASFCSSCQPTTDPVTPLDKAYESCCGAEAVEYHNSVADAHVYVPNIFTPNGDGVNDRFQPFVSGNIDHIADFQIFSATGDSLLHYRQVFDFANVDGYGWNGNRPDGTEYKGAFKYLLFAIAKDGSKQMIEGRACRVVCGADASALKDNKGCFYPSQAGTNGNLDATLETKEVDCYK